MAIGAALSTDQPKKKRDRHRTQWAAQFAVASELCKLDYQVALTLGNHPGVDLMVISPKGRMFKVEVKGLYKPDYWQLRKRESEEGLFYIFAYVPDRKPNQFFIIKQAIVNQLLDEHRAKLPPDYPNYRWGLLWTVVRDYCDKWNVLPDYQSLSHV